MPQLNQIPIPLKPRNRGLHVLLKIKQVSLFGAAILMAFGLSAETSYSQVDGDGAGDNNQQVQNVANQNVGVGGANVQTGDGSPEVGNNVEIELSENTRNQGFVGATTASVTNPDNGAFIGAVSNDSGPPLTDDASFGGGVNTRTPLVGSATTGGGGGGQGGGFGGATGPTTTITRRSVRARLRPNFFAPRLSDQAVSNRFQSRFSRQPGSGVVGNGYSVRVQDRTAFVTGSVNSQGDSDRIVRQLRLEPGVYRVVNELSISNQQSSNGQSSQQPVTNQQPFSNQQPVSAPANPGVSSGFTQPVVQPEAFPPIVQPLIIQQSYQQPILQQPVIQQPVPVSQIQYRGN